MLDSLFEQMNSTYGRDTEFMGLAFRFKKGIAIIDFHNDGNVAKYIVEFVSFIEHEPPISKVVENKDELHTLILELAL
ncbi:hypothetical protein BLGI_4548 [Brevibacillus laterosporus GI-9]|uniref:hypothetical protein n=1 Tax=Brevibacillus TaxID=55080 RepID=UPI000240521C|nr:MULTISPECIES: hypothetical protein [Brevibacillus]MCR8963683.1 hypothetical protein [Brevibacillus laterosporus]MCZ0835839.1 hypothetical protein [Brevibacillus halotolerans]CCF16579.1 hypothetical protein BLGI_4548 [Brevibacillus laterosporus GI-9]